MTVKKEIVHIEPLHDEATSNQVIHIIQTLDVLIRNATEQQLPYVQQVLGASKERLVEWVANGEYYLPVRDTLMRMLQMDSDLEFS